jgi:glycopeptide antibiotics resistance protein
MLLRHPFLSLATFGYLAVVAWITLGPQPLDDEGRGALLRVIRWLQAREATSWVTYDGVEFTANVLMFLPIGLMFVLLLGRRRWWAAILLGVALTVAIESTQLFLHDRVPDARDLLSNSIGATLGVFAALLVTWPKAHALRRRSPALRA